MYAFNYHRAKTVADALKLYKKAEDPKFLAGGHTLIPTLKQRLARPSDLIDISGIATLKGIKVSKTAVTIGALTPHVEVATSSAVKKAIPALAGLAEEIGDPQVRHRGTMGGSVANSDPAADYPAAVLGLGATIETNARKIEADKFFKGVFETALKDGEILTKISFPVPEKAGYMRFDQPASRFALVGVFVAKFKTGVRVAVTGAGPCAFRVPAMEKALSAKFAPEAIEGITVPHDDLNSDIHGSAEYRAHLITVMAKRAVAAAK